MRRASISSLDESSQKCDENNGGNGANGGGGGSKAGFMLETPGGAGGRPTYREDARTRFLGKKFSLLEFNIQRSSVNNF